MCVHDARLEDNIQTLLVSITPSLRKLTLRLWRITALVSFIGIGSLASAQVTMSTTATGGGKSYLSIDSKAVVTNIDTLFARLDSLSNKVDALNWGDVLDNDATATQDLDLNGKNATGASRIEGDTIVSTVTTTDSLSVPGNATIDGELVVADTIRAAAPALFADSVFVGGPLVATSVNSSTLSTNSMLLYVQASEFMVIESGNSGTWGDIDILAPVGKITLDSDDLITLNSTGTTSGNSGVVINAERVSISNVLNINPQATAPVLPDDGDVWLEALSSTTANLKIYYNGI
jgi:hypothetical protein